jgi:NAD(P)-dependent dehydrogenase (short-subunit alcohol dehydrogenase family)
MVRAMSFSASNLPAQQGKTVIITGGNSGIGYEAARALAKKGAEVVLACRSVSKGNDAAARILAETPDSKVSVSALDLASLASVADFAARFKDTHGKLDLLINNAGVMAIPRALTRDGFEMQIGTNHFGPFALTARLSPLFLATPNARVVTVSSQASRWSTVNWDDLDGATHYMKWTAYGQSKFANLLFAFELARKLEARGTTVRSVACHPGYASTNLQFVGPELEKSALSRMVMTLGNRLFAQSAEAGAWPTLYAATADDARNGDYIGPRGIGEWWGQPTHVEPRRAAKSPELAQKLWAISVERTGVDLAS